MSQEIEINLSRLKPDKVNDSIMKWFQDPELMKYYTNSNRVITKEELIDSIKEGERLQNQYTYGIYAQPENKIIGTVKIGPIDVIHKTSDLVVLIGDRDYLGKGLAVKAINAGNQIAFQELGIRRLQGGMYESNVPSIKAYRKAGWVVEGRLKGFYYVNGKNEARILVACFNPDYFSQEEINFLKEHEDRYI
jgi:RimJ/RimL family protein N-acetyltransferase